MKTTIFRLLISSQTNKLKDLIHQLIQHSHKLWVSCGLYPNLCIQHLGHPSHQHLLSRHTCDSSHTHPACSEPARPPWNVPAHLARVTSSARSLGDRQEGVGMVLGDGSPGSAQLAAALWSPRETLFITSHVQQVQNCSSFSTEHAEWDGTHKDHPCSAGPTQDPPQE